MTYKEWITKTVARFEMTADDVELILANSQELISNPESEVNIRTAKTALVNEFATLIPLADLTEGGYAVKWNWKALLLWYRINCQQLGITPIEEKPKPKIRNKSNVW